MIDAVYQCVKIWYMNSRVPMCNFSCFCPNMSLCVKVRHDDCLLEDLRWNLDCELNEYVITYPQNWKKKHQESNFQHILWIEVLIGIDSKCWHFKLRMLQIFVGVCAFGRYRPLAVQWTQRSLLVPCWRVRSWVDVNSSSRSLSRNISYTSFFKVTFWFLKWRSLKPWEGYLWVQTRSLWRTWYKYYIILVNIVYS